jgi:hypothetical protein
MAKRKNVDFDSLFPEDIDQYYEFANSFAMLNSEDYTTAYNLSIKAWVLAERWNDIMAQASKLAILKNVNKTDLKDYCYGKYRQLHLAHEFTRCVYNKGERQTR